MIAKLKGRLDSQAEDSLIIDVNGVGYLVFASGKTLGKMPEAGGEVSLLIETHVREDHIHLYGFNSPEEKEWFGILQNVQGVGAKVALAILSVFEPQGLIQAIAAGDKAAVARANGVGPKLATRIVTELKDKAGNLSLKAPSSGLGPAKDQDALSQAISALTNLGYSRTEAFSAASQAAHNGASRLDDIIRASLKLLGPKV